VRHLLSLSSATDLPDELRVGHALNAKQET